MHNQDQDEVIRFQLQRIFAVLGRGLLVMVEDLKSVHDNNFNKLQDNLPPECGPVVDMSNYFDENQYNRMRKRILDVVNSSKRDLEQILRDIN